MPIYSFKAQRDDMAHLRGEIEQRVAAQMEDAPWASALRVRADGGTLHVWFNVDADDEADALRHGNDLLSSATPERFGSTIGRPLG